MSPTACRFFWPIGGGAAGHAPPRGGGGGGVRLPPLCGYLLAAIAIGPFSPGFVADTEIATQLADVGVILLMFGVGLHFSTADLMAAGWIAVPGALVQIVS